MAEIIWTEPALSDLDAIADYIALENPQAASELVRRVFARVERLAEFPDSGTRLSELRGTRYRQIVETPCRVFHRHEGDKGFILYVMRGERLLRKGKLVARERRGKR